jgi:hypothetical protein
VPPVRRLVRRSLGEGGSLGEVGSVVKISVLENESTFGNLPELTPEPNWNVVKRHFRRYGNPLKTAEKYGIKLGDLNARARPEGWV